MRDLQNAVQVLLQEDCTCVLCKDGDIRKSHSTGISPMLDWLAAGEELSGFSAADRIVGKAAAMLFALAGIRAVHAQVLSQSALEFLNARNIAVTYDVITDSIRNRRNDGICPMEQATAELSAPEDAFPILLATRERLRKGE
jgi:hypothetical protein